MKILIVFEELIRLLKSQRRDSLIVEVKVFPKERKIEFWSFSQKLFEMEVVIPLKTKLKIKNEKIILFNGEFEKLLTVESAIPNQPVCLYLSDFHLAMDGQLVFESDEEEGRRIYNNWVHSQ